MGRKKFGHFWINFCKVSLFLLKTRQNYKATIPQQWSSKVNCAPFFTKEKFTCLLAKLTAIESIKSEKNLGFVYSFKKKRTKSPQSSFACKLAKMKVSWFIQKCVIEIKRVFY